MCVYQQSNGCFITLDTYPRLIRETDIKANFEKKRITISILQNTYLLS